MYIKVDDGSIYIGLCIDYVSVFFCFYGDGIYFYFFYEEIR